MKKFNKCARTSIPKGKSKLAFIKHVSKAKVKNIFNIHTALYIHGKKHNFILFIVI